MVLPMLQLALDNKTLADALASTRVLATEVDVLEAGTILCCSEGMQAVRCLKSLYPNRIVLADIKAADAGTILANMVYDNGADWMTRGAFRTLKELGYTGSYLVEMWTDKSPDPAGDIRKAREWMIQRMREGGLL